MFNRLIRCQLKSAFRKDAHVATFELPNADVRRRRDFLHVATDREDLGGCGDC